MAKNTKKTEKIDYHARQVRRNQIIFATIALLVIVSMIVTAIAQL